VVIIAVSAIRSCFAICVIPAANERPPAAFVSFVAEQIDVPIATVAATSLTRATTATMLPWLAEALRDLNIGIVALLLNVLRLAVVSAVIRRTPFPRSA
jgi:SSS family solute:Na+ symporter